MKARSKLALLMIPQSGVSLVEIMVALILSIVLLVGVGQIYMSSKQTYRVQDGQSRLQENARYALELLARDIREAGFQGCQRMSSIPPRVIALAPGNDFANTSAIMGNDSMGMYWGAAWNPVLPETLTNAEDGDRVITGTDVITVQFATSCGGEPISAASTNSITIPATNTCGVKVSTGCDTAAGCQGDILVLADCRATEVFRADTATPTKSSDAPNPTVISITGTTTNTATAFSKTYTTGDAELMRLNSHSYYIRKGQSGEPALWRLDNTTRTGGDNPEELVEGIEDMQILYGIDTDTPSDGSPNQYVTAGNVSDWTLVTSVQVTLAVRSVGENADNLTEERSYTFNGANLKDRRIKKEFVATISLRNRVH